MSQTWAVARHMIAEAIRMKVAVVFLLLLAVLTLGLPFLAEGDGSLSGRVQGYLSYALTATAVLLSLLTILMTRGLSDELANRQILITMTKPVPRWQYIFGKWVGITTLNTVLLVGAVLVIYVMIHVIIWMFPKSDMRYDEDRLQNEVLVARHAVSTEYPDFVKLAEREYERNKEEGRYAGDPMHDPAQERARIVAKIEWRWRTVPVHAKRRFHFKNVLVDRSEDNSIQLRYKARVTQYSQDELFKAMWVFGNLSKNTYTVLAVPKHVVGRFHTITVPATVVADDNTLDVEFINENPYVSQGDRQTMNTIQFIEVDGVDVLFAVGSFEGNLLRLTGLMLCKLMFLGAVGLLMASMFSFPVAALCSFTVYLLAGTRSFMDEAFQWGGREGFANIEAGFMTVAGWLYRVVSLAMPNFGYYDGVETLVNGQNVTLIWLLQGIGFLVLLRTTMVLGLTMLMFHRREVAEVSI